MQNTASEQEQGRFLDPEQLDDVALAAEAKLLRAGAPKPLPNTVRSYRTAQRYWVVWFEQRYGRTFSLPLSVDAVLQFITDHTPAANDVGELKSQLPTAVASVLAAAGFKTDQGTPAFSTLRLRIQALSTLHKLEGQPSPCNDGRVRELLSSARRGYEALGANAAGIRKQPLLVDPLEALLDTCDDRSLIGLRDQAMLLFGFSSGGRRRSEISNANVEDLRKVPGGYLFRLRPSNSTSSAVAGQDDERPIAGRAALALARWLAAAKITSGPVFRQVWDRGLAANSRVGDTALSPETVRTIVIQRCRLAGLPPEHYSTRSLRSGFILEAASQGVPVGQSMHMTGIRSVAALLAHLPSDQKNSALRGDAMSSTDAA